MINTIGNSKVDIEMTVIWICLTEVQRPPPRNAAEIHFLVYSFSIMDETSKTVWSLSMLI